MAEQNNDLIAGRNAVSEALRSQRSINKILLQEGAHGGSLGEIIALAKQKGVPVETVKAEKLDKLAKGLRHQGVAALAAPIAFRTLDDVFARAAEKNEEPFILLLDERCCRSAWRADAASPQLSAERCCSQDFRRCGRICTGCTNRQYRPDYRRA